MEYRTLGRTGVQVSALCLGTGNFGSPSSEETSRQVMQTALDAGINFFDTANYYNDCESERIIGRFLKDTGQRDRVILTHQGLLSRRGWPERPGAQPLPHHARLRGLFASAARPTISTSM